MKKNAFAISVSTLSLLHGQNSGELISAVFWFGNNIGAQPEPQNALLVGLYWWLHSEQEHAVQALRQGDERAIWRGIAIARAYGQRGDIDSAFSLLNLIDKSIPSIGDIDCVRGATYLAAGDRTKAIEAYERATTAKHFVGIECVNTDTARASLARIYLDAKMWEQAHPYCIALLSSSEYRHLALVGLGQVSFAMNPTQEGAIKAEQYLKTAIAEDRQNLQAYLKMADIYRRIGEYGLAETILQQELEVFQLPDSRPHGYIPVQEHRFYILVSYGETLLAEGRVREAVQRLKEAIEIGRFHWSGDLWLGRAYLANGECDKAYQEFLLIQQKWPHIQYYVDDLEELKRMRWENACR